MSVLCHRCGGDLAASDLFCPNCGSPQVKFDLPEEGESTYANARPTRLSGSFQGICWRDAVHSALIAAVPSGILSAVSVLSWGCCLWVGSGAVVSIGLYRKRAPASTLNARSGARIGALAGLIAAYTSVFVTAVSRVVDRFVLHRGTEIDHFYEIVIQQSTAFIQSNPAAQAQWHSYLHFLLSPDGRAAYMLMNSVTTSLGIIIVSAVGGALGVRLFAAHKRPLSNG